MNNSLGDRQAVVVFKDADSEKLSSVFAEMAGWPGIESLENLPAWNGKGAHVTLKEGPDELVTLKKINAHADVQGVLPPLKYLMDL